VNTSHHSYGLAFKKLDLHLHTPASSCFDDSASVTPEQLVAAALDVGLDGIAVTDHNSGAWVDRVKEAAKPRGLVVFPGVEITCQGGKEGVHVIGLFEIAQGTAHIESLLGDLGLRPEDYGNKKTIVQKTIQEVIETINRRGGLAVLAHANSSHGALSEMRGEQRTRVVQHPHLAAVEATDFRQQTDTGEANARKRTADVLDGSDPTYQRKVAVFQASDNPLDDGSGQHCIQGIGTRCAYFKLDRISLAGLRQCFNDPDVRIRQDYEYTTTAYPRIRHIRIRGGFLDGVDAPLHEGLNSVLGGKGAGKSLLIEFMRFTLDQPSTNQEILEDYQHKLEARLEPFSTVELVLSDETGRDFTVKRTFRDHDDSPFENSDHSAIARLFPTLFLSQNEIIRIAESQDEQIAFIDRFFDFRSYQQDISDTEQELRQKDHLLADSLQAFREYHDLLETHKRAATEISKIEESLKKPAFEEYRRLEAKDRAFRDQQGFLDGRIEAIRTFRDDLLQPEPQPLPDFLKDDPALQRNGALLESCRTEIAGRLDALLEHLTTASGKLKTEHERWQPDYVQGRASYEAVVQQEGGDYKALAARRTRLVKDQEALTKRVTALKTKSDRIKQITTDRQALLDRLKGVYDQYTRMRQEKCDLFQRESNGRLQITIHAASNKDAFRHKLSQLKRGSYLKDVEVERICQSVDSYAFVRAVINYDLSNHLQQLQDIARAANIDEARLRTFFTFLLESMDYKALLALQYEAMPEDRPEIRYNVGNGTYEPLTRLSIGQKCTAMLIMALSDGTMPVIIDQPEDSLDLKSVWEDMCLKIRHGKERRQFIFTTHNSSLAVAGDSDKLLIMEGNADKGRILYSGSMDEGPVSDEALRFLEGGIPTYRLKYLKYNAEKRLTE